MGSGSGGLLGYVEVAGGGCRRWAGGAAGFGPRFCRREESKGKGGGQVGGGRARPGVMLCWLPSKGDKETDHVLASWDFQISSEGMRLLKWLLISKALVIG